MILVMGTIKMAAGEGERARPVLAKHATDCSAEAGCEDYSFAFDANDPDLIRISERWESPDALANHGEAGHQREFGQALRDFAVERVSVKAWDGAYWRTLIGE